MNKFFQVKRGDKMLKKRKPDQFNKYSSTTGTESTSDTTSAFDPVVEEEPTPPAPVDPPAPMAQSNKTVIGQHIFVEGTVRGNEDLVIEGSMKGTIELEKHQVTVGSTGQVEADITADNVTISGHFVGNVAAHGKVEITKAADFSGEIKAKSISVEDGAYLKAVIELEREGKAKTPLSSKPVLKFSSGSSTSVSDSTFTSKKPDGVLDLKDVVD